MSKKCFSAGNQTQNYANTRSSAEQLTNDGVRILTVTITGIPDVTVLREISTPLGNGNGISEGTTYWLYMNFEDLGTQTFKILQMVSSICNATLNSGKLFRKFSTAPLDTGDVLLYCCKMLLIIL